MNNPEQYLKEKLNIFFGLRNIRCESECVSVSTGTYSKDPVSEVLCTSRILVYSKDLESDGSCVPQGF